MATHKITSIAKTTVSPVNGVSRAIMTSRFGNASFTHVARRTLSSPRPTFTVKSLVAAEASMDVIKMSPLGDRILIKPKEQESKTAGGILLAAGSTPKMEDALVGTVLSVGDEVDIGVAIGDLVLFTKYGSSDVEVPDGEVCFVAQKSILAKLS